MVQMCLAYNTEKIMLMLFATLLLLMCRYADANGAHIYPRILQERSTSGKLALMLNKMITLNLEKSTVLVDNLLFVTSTKDQQKVEMVDTSDIQQSIYHDTHYQSSVMVRQEGGNVEVEGIVSHNLRIRPLPEGERSLQGQVPHMLFEVPLTENFSEVEPEFPRLRERSNRNNSSGNLIKYPQSRASGLQRFPVEVHIVSDKAHQKYFKDNLKLIAYLAIMMNAVNLRYLDTTNPKIDFLLVGVTRAKDHDFAQTEGRYIDAGEMISGLKLYKSQGRILGHHDVVYLITGYDITKWLAKGKRYNGIRGRAKLGTVCTHLGLGEGEDKPHGYLGVNTIAHELGHTLGAEHDRSPECPWKDGYLMSYEDGGLKKFRLSQCSERSIREYVRTLSDDCIRVLNGQNYLRDQRKYPGQTIRKKYYCRKLMGNTKETKNVFVKKADNCFLQCCLEYPHYTSCAHYKMLDGMSCDPGKTCRRGVCAKH
ncbi:venom metalloproteinase antarease-like TtrivMP_A [Rhipicephalus sanguineus]|uniref:venom metalloproteinase antarease-like TtrivMP_A n=1 Tax=Rhipicephalus sanguineus TaxID=34632 RepID=UPI0018941D9F|nr:venom metalloproteinase antarease-like TtrivMP_A [Rhipicephalus sanguineus]